MGVCFSCCLGDNHRSNRLQSDSLCLIDSTLASWTQNGGQLQLDLFTRERKYKRTRVFSTESLVETQSQPNRNVTREFNKDQISSLQDFINTIGKLDHKAASCSINAQPTYYSENHHQWEMMELDEEPAETRRDTFRIAHITQPSDTTNSAKLVFWNNHLYWLKDAEDWKLRNEFGSQGETSHIEASVPLLRCESSIADTSSIAGSQKWERLPAGNGTSGSSIDLEWENEAGLTPPPHFIIPTADDLTWLGLSDVSSNHSHPSTPVSNGNDLEWDFTSVPVNEDDDEKDQATTINNKTENGNIER